MSKGPTTFLRNQWYVAGFPEEFSDKPMARTIFNEPVVLYRGEDGMPGIVSDRCPHRFAPLSSGDVVGNDIRCGYHGIAFGRDGACTHVPGGLTPPRNFRVKSYPAVEKHGFVFMWMGDKAADPALIPDFFENGDPGWKGVPGYLHIKGNYQLMVDNILDLTHVVFVHKTTLAGGGVTETPLEVEVTEDRVRAHRIMFDVDTAPIYRAARGYNDKIDRWQIFEWQPPMFCKVTLGARPAGADTPLREPVHVVVNSFTPETDNTVHYFWSTARNWAIDDPKITELYRSMIDMAFREDADIVERQQRHIDSHPGGAVFVNFAFDRAGQAARRILSGMIAAENAAKNTENATVQAAE